jgi:chromate reductase, NAD(P)H dehydrogenase (quinone)
MDTIPITANARPIGRNARWPELPSATNATPTAMNANPPAIDLFMHYTFLVRLGLGVEVTVHFPSVHILGVCGSLQASSGNLDLLRTAARLAPLGVDVILTDLLRDLPFLNPELEAIGVPPPVEAWRRALAGSDAVLIASPEYGHSLPGALKNAVDWVIGSGELEQKVVATTAAVPHLDPGRRGLQALGQTLRSVSAVVVGEQPIVRGPEFEIDVRELLALLVTRVTEVNGRS